MDKIRFISIAFVCNILLDSCGLIPKSLANSQQDIKQNETNTENLSDGNYNYCSDPPSGYDSSLYGDDPDSYRWCFTFTKKGFKVIGGYSYNAPHDTPFICIEGTVEDNLITGVGYQLIGPSSQPYTEEDFENFENLPLNTELRYWDTHEGLQGGFNLKVSNLSLYKLSSSGGRETKTYWASQRYKNVQLDVKGFEKIKLDYVFDYNKCSG